MSKNTRAQRTKEWKNSHRDQINQYNFYYRNELDWDKEKLGFTSNQSKEHFKSVGRFERRTASSAMRLRPSARRAAAIWLHLSGLLTGDARSVGRGVVAQGCCDTVVEQRVKVQATHQPPDGVSRLVKVEKTNACFDDVVEQRVVAVVGVA